MEFLSWNVKGLGGRWIKEVGLGVLLWETVCGVGGVGVCKGINENLVLWDGQALKVLKRFGVCSLF